MGKPKAEGALPGMAQVYCSNLDTPFTQFKKKKHPQDIVINKRETEGTSTLRVFRHLGEAPSILTILE